MEEALCLTFFLVELPLEGRVDMLILMMKPEGNSKKNLMILLDD